MFKYLHKDVIVFDMFYILLSIINHFKTVRSVVVFYAVYPNYSACEQDTNDTNPRMHIKANDSRYGKV